MRAFNASSIGAACAVAVVLPLLAPTAAAAATDSASRAASAVEPPAAPPAATSVRLPGSTQSLPLVPLAPPRPSGGPDRARSAAPGHAAAHGLPARDTEPFSLLGVVWEDPEEELHGRVEVRTRTEETGGWTTWQELETHSHDRPDAAPAERRGDDLRGGTPPMWVGDSDGVQIRVLPEAGHSAAELPEGLRLELVDPGDEPSQETASWRHRLSPRAFASSLANARLAPVGADEIPAAGREEPQRDLLSMSFGDRDIIRIGAPRITGPLSSAAPRPAIVTRKGWGADEGLREPDFAYTNTVKVAFVHHTGMSNDYTCAQAPSIIRSIYRYHVQSNGWRDVGYNFFVDKCGTVYEGRAGGVARPVMGAHTGGFNTDSTGIAVLGTHSSVEPPPAVVDAVSAVAAWKLDLHGVAADGTSVLTSAGSNKHAKGRKVGFQAVSGHRDGFVTDCPGDRLYAQLDTIRANAARLQAG